MQGAARRSRVFHGRASAFALLLGAATPTLAQAPSSSAPPQPAQSLGEAPDGAPEGGRTYTPADFARFSPRSALDMLANVPGFSIDAGDTTSRGLGQATGNVLINGERFTGRSSDITAELARISAANVARIEIADGATFNISGLTGQVANIVTSSRGLQGNFTYRPQVRRDRTPPRLLAGDISVNGPLGPFEFSLSLRNDSVREGNAGLEIVSTPLDTILDRRDEVLSINDEQARLAGSLRRRFDSGAVLNLNGGVGLYRSDLREDSVRAGPGLPDRRRILVERERAQNYDFGGDYEFRLLGGRLKLIGSRRVEHRSLAETLTEDFGAAAPASGQRFEQAGDETETILRGEYRWRGGGNDWQFSLEGALNRLDVGNSLSALVGAQYVTVPGTQVESIVSERRVEATLTLSRPLSSTLTFQAALGAEYSELTQTGAGGLSRRFLRPKGFINLAWRPGADLDISARIQRAVDQLNFFDFVASSNVNNGTANAGNADLVPPQRWNGQIQMRRAFGPWGTITGRLHGSLITDVVDVIPIGAMGQSPGNLPGTAYLYGLQITGTVNFDPAGWSGAKIDANLNFQRSSLEDPLTLRRRPFNETMTRELDITLRHDVPNTPWAWGLTYYEYRESAGFRLDQRSLRLDTPGDLIVFVEHKDLLGLTVRASIGNMLGMNESFSRTFFAGRRNASNSNILFTESRDRSFGPVFTLAISGTI